MWGRNFRGAVILTPVVSSPLLLLSFPLEMCPPPAFCWGAGFTLFSLQIPLWNHSVFIHSSSRYKGTRVPPICTKDCAGSSRTTEWTQSAPLLCNFCLLWSGEPGVVISKTSNISGLTWETLTSYSFLSWARGSRWLYYMHLWYRISETSAQLLTPESRGKQQGSCTQAFCIRHIWNLGSLQTIMGWQIWFSCESRRKNETVKQSFVNAYQRVS